MQEQSADEVRDSDWYDRFWDALQEQDEDGPSANRLIAEMYADGLFWRDGDHLVGREGNKTFLTIDDQHLVRRILAAADAAALNDG
jgi:hypothetical protein